LALVLGLGQFLLAQNLPMPEGRRLRDIVAEKYPEGNLLVGATTGSWGFSNPIGELMDREFSYVTPENDFKHSVIRSDPDQWSWDRADAWLQHIIDNDQVLRMHGPIAPQCSRWAKEDLRTAEELSEELDTFMTALCLRYNGVEGIQYLDVVNEIALPDGSWLGPKPGTDSWENPWFKIGQDNDPNHTPLYVSQAFGIAKKHAPDLKLILNNHCHPGTAGMEKVKETILYLRERGYRVDGLGWQAHLDVGWATTENLQELREVIDWCEEQNLEFHITEFDAWITNLYTQSLEDQAYTYKSIMDVLVEKQDGLTIGWNTWHITDAAGWKPERIPSVFDEQYKPKPAYYALQLALEARGDYSTPYQLTVQVRNAQTGEVIEGCELSMNGETGSSDPEGKLVFQALTAGRYTLEARAEHMDFLRKGTSIYKDTVLSVYLTPAQYEVTYHVSDLKNGLNLSAVDVSLDTLVLRTNLSGDATCYLQQGTYRAEFSRSGYRSYILEHELQSDTSLEIQLVKTHGLVKFRLKDGSRPVNGAKVVLETDTLSTNTLGICTFESLPLDSSYSYSITKDNYYALSGDLYLEQDSTLDLQFPRSVANVTFQLDESSSDALHACVILEADTAWFSKEGIAKFYNYPLENDFRFQILSENYPALSGTLHLAGDTTVMVSLASTMLNERSAEPEYQIYPNPASNMIRVHSSDPFESVELLNTAGVSLRLIQVRDLRVQMDVSDLKAGYYWLLLGRSGGEKVLRALVVN
jgi:GH35 family endo-1,4-beta-xylanase